MDRLTPHKVRHLSLAEMQPTDWYERRDELESGMVFRCRDGSVVKLDHRVPGDATKWRVASYYEKGRWCHDEDTIEPGDLAELLPEDYAD